MMMMMMMMMMMTMNDECSWTIRTFGNPNKTLLKWAQEIQDLDESESV